MSAPRAKHGIIPTYVTLNKTFFAKNSFVGWTDYYI